MGGIVLEGDGVAVGLGVITGVGDGVTTGVAVGLSVGTGVITGVAVGEGVTIGVGVGFGDLIGFPALGGLSDLAYISAPPLLTSGENAIKCYALELGGNYFRSAWA